MPADSSWNLQAAFPAIAAVLGMLATGLWLLPDPLGSTRPQAADSPYRSIGDQDVQARLWADPFRAVAEYRKAKAATQPAGTADAGAPATGPHSVADLQITLKQFIAGIDGNRSDSKLLILPAIVRAAPYAEDAENRLRTRYALLAALNVSGYVPHDNEHVGFITAPWFTDGEVRKLRSATEASATQPPVKPSTWIDVPYEWFTKEESYPATQNTSGTPAAATRPTSGGPDGTRAWATHVLVLWLDDAAFNHRPLVRLATFINSLFAGPQSSDLRAKTWVRLLGPPSSQSLHEVLQDPYMLCPVHGNNDSPFQVDASLAKFDIFSYRATACADALSCGFDLPQIATTTQPVFLDVHNARDLVQIDPCSTQPVAMPTTATTPTPIYRTVVTDDILADCIYKELENRGVKAEYNPSARGATDDSDRIAIISEWDTFYGRSLPLTFDAVLRRRMYRAASPGATTPTLLEFIHQSLAQTNAFDTSQNELDKNVFFFSYLRGIDGAAYGQSDGYNDSDAASGSRTNAASEDSSHSAANGAMNNMIRASDPSAPPDGTRQFDYARRIAAKIVSLNRMLQDNHRHGIRAVGILGSDVYDKLLILEALRNQLPNAYFFTTELDNRLLDPRELPFTQGMLVGSDFGLSLANRYQHDIPPFRDSNQTALFLAGLIATNAVSPNQFPTSPAAHLFEIGRNGEIDLSDDDAVYNFQAGAPTIAADMAAGSGGRWLHPPRHAFDSTFTLARYSGYAGALLVLAGIIFAVFSSRFQQFLRSLLKRAPSGTARPVSREELQAIWMKNWTILSGISVSALIFLIYLENIHSGAEPFALTSGISLWPTEFLRLAVSLLTGYFLIYGHFCLLANQEEIANCYVLQAPKIVGVKAWFKSDAFPRIVTAARRFELLCRGAVRPIYLGTNGSMRRPRKTKRLLTDLGDFLFAWAAGLISDLWAINTWANETPSPKYSTTLLWKRYQELGFWPRRLARVLVPSLVVFLILLCCFELLGIPDTPGRGLLFTNYKFDSFIIFPAVVSLIVINCFVIDASRLCKVLSDKLRGDSSDWPLIARQRKAAEKGMDPDDMGDWMDVQLLAERSQPIVSLIYFPFIILSIMILSRLTIFDRLGFPPPFLITYLFLAGCSVAAALILRKAAEQTRQDALANLEKRRLWLMNAAAGPTYPALRAIPNQAPTTTERLRQVEALIADVRSEQRGAFAPFSQQPVVRAVLLQTGGVGLWSLLERFSALPWS